MRQQTSQRGIDAAIRAFQAGEPVLIHDAADREGETDLCYPAGAVEPADVARLRNDAGGLICVAIAHELAEHFGLPFRHEIVDHPITDHDPAYDDRPSFSLTVNHRSTRTGVTDRDRSRTIRAIASAAATPETFDFDEEFRAPGHIHLLRASDGLLATRRGHTELGITLAEMAQCPPAVVVCEMLDDDTGEALTPGAAQAYASSNGLAYVEGSAVASRSVPVTEADPQRS